MTSANRQPQDASIPEPPALENMAVLQPPSINWLSPKFLTPLGAQPMAAHNPQIFAAEPAAELTSEAPSFEPSPFFPDLRSPTRTYDVAVQPKREPDLAPSADEFEPLLPLQAATPFDDFSELLDLAPSVGESRSATDSAPSTAVPSQPTVTSPALVQRQAESGAVTQAPTRDDSGSEAPSDAPLAWGEASFPVNIPTVDRVSPPTFTPIPEFTAEPELIQLKPAPRLPQPPATPAEPRATSEAERSQDPTSTFTEISGEAAIDVQAAAIAPPEPTGVDAEVEANQPTTQISPYLLSLQQVSLPSPASVQLRVDPEAISPLPKRPINRAKAPATFDAAIAESHERLADDFDFEVSLQPSDSVSSSAVDSPRVQRQAEPELNEPAAIAPASVPAALTDSEPATLQQQPDLPTLSAQSPPPSIQAATVEAEAVIAPSESGSVQRQLDLPAPQSSQLSTQESVEVEAEIAPSEPAIQAAAEIEAEAIAPSESAGIQRQLDLPASQSSQSPIQAAPEVEAEIAPSEPVIQAAAEIEAAIATSESAGIQRQLDLPAPQSLELSTQDAQIEAEAGQAKTSTPASIQRQINLPTFQSSELPTQDAQIEADFAAPVLQRAEATPTSESTSETTVELETAIAPESLPATEPPAESPPPDWNDASLTASEVAIARFPEASAPMSEATAASEADAVMVLGESTLTPSTSTRTTPDFPATPPGESERATPPPSLDFSPPTHPDQASVAPPVVQSRLEPELEASPFSRGKGQSPSDPLPAEAEAPSATESLVEVEPAAISPSLPSIQPRLETDESLAESVEAPGQPASMEAPVNGEQRDFPALPRVLTNLSTLRPLGNVQPLVQRAEQPAAEETEVESFALPEGPTAQDFDLPVANFDLSPDTNFVDAAPAASPTQPETPAINVNKNGSTQLPTTNGDRPSTQHPSISQVQAKLDHAPATNEALEPAVQPQGASDALDQPPTDGDPPAIPPPETPDLTIAQSPLVPQARDGASPEIAPPIQRQTVVPPDTDSVESPAFPAETEEPAISAAEVAAPAPTTPDQESAIAPNRIQPRLEPDAAPTRIDPAPSAERVPPAPPAARPTTQPNHPTETPAAWSDIADLLTQTTPTVQRRITPDTLPTEQESAAAAPVSPVPPPPPPISIAPAPTATPAETTVAAPAEAPSEMVEVSGKPTAQPEESDKLERLAREIYHLLRQRLEIERERSGNYYRDRLY
ncbi:MAG TPA: hypothetical protein IGS53_04365 [Leptolyngbyaceae cyanobacterium M33_DOE_097]|uniref:Uncharacterized protein n=1 Tax=Oscillatoriales cyanobacterium SpSt-418 TaxID=2282169 RepID=A0A7C3KFL8_9CYAN|nr:hypothetical protein [Leptolyngbyaceae cyanobacterium M33_DOE_097]